MTNKSNRKNTILFFAVVLSALYVVNCFSLFEAQIYHVNESNSSASTEKNQSNSVRFFINCSMSVMEGAEFTPEVDKNSSNCFDSAYSFCTDAINYPSVYIKEKLKLDTNYRKFFSKRRYSTGNKNYDKTRSQGIDRQYFTSKTNSRGPTFSLDDGESLCQSVSKLLYLKAAKNTENDWRFVINQENFTQGVRVEECVSNGDSCMLTSNFPNGYRTECHQEYSTRVLLALTKSGDIVPDVFAIPSCCKCLLYRTDV